MHVYQFHIELSNLMQFIPFDVMYQRPALYQQQIKRASITAYQTPGQKVIEMPVINVCAELTNSR